VVFVVVSTAYNVRVPLYEAPDEAAHARYVESIVSDGELPRFETHDEYESWQPPLFYAAGAGALLLLQLDSPPELAWNPRFPLQKNNYIHTDDEEWPYSGPVLSAHVLRGVSMLFGAGTVIFIYLTALLVFPGRRLLAFAAAATAALLPQFAFISSTVSNDAASFFCAAAVVYFGLRHLREGRDFWLLFAVLALGLGLLSKTTVWIAGIVPFVSVFYHSRGVGHIGVRLVMLLMIPPVVAGWFYIRSVALWGEPFPGYLMFWMEPRPIWDSYYSTIFLQDLSRSFWYVGGAFNVKLDPLVYDILSGTFVLAIAGLIVSFASSRFNVDEKRAVLVLTALPLLALGTVLYFSITQDFQTQARYLFVAMPAFAILLPLGVGALFTRESVRDHASMLALPAILLVTNIWILADTLPATYGLATL
jgi:4-amino-4-deoxy-L-arabinose transferase-like glycosyltransferase